MRPLVVVPARGGSKRLLNKNIKLLGNKPLIQYTIEAARQVFKDDLIAVSTEDEKIKNVVEEMGLAVPFLRPEELATDESPTDEVLLHAVSYFEGEGYYPDVLILLQPTSPFRKSWHIKEALDYYSDTYDMVVSVKETRSNPYYLLFEEDPNGYLQKSKNGNFSARQGLPKVWEYNGAIYIINVKSLKDGPVYKFKKVKKYVMSEYASHDIDTELDWLIAEQLLDLDEF